MGKRSFGEVSRLPSGRYRARYTGPDGRRHSAPHTFDTKADADAWLTLERATIVTDDWSPVPTTRTTFGPYAAAWLADRPLKPRTRAHYAALLTNQIGPTFDPLPLRSITPAMVRKWHADLGDRAPTLRAHAYSLLRAILGSAVYDGEIKTANPAHIRGAGNAKRKHKIEPATLAELEAITAELPARYRPMILLAAWCGLRFGELVELRRKDVDLTNGVLHVRRGAVRVDGTVIIGTPKTAAGIREVAIPPHLIPVLREHLGKTITGGRDGLLFPGADGRTLAPSTLYGVYYPAREKAGRPDLRFHDLRHTGAVLAAATGATLAELMARLGHTTAGAALRYQHAAAERDKAIAAKLSELATRS